MGDRLAVLVTAEGVARGKPDPDGFEVAIAALAREPALSDRLIHPHEVVAVEGRPAGLAAAGAAGIRTLAVGLGAGAGAEAEASVASLSELSPARLAELFPDRFVR